MYYNRILRVWIIDQFDYFLISIIIGSLVASYIKKYLSEKEAQNRLKNSIIQKSKLKISKPPILNSKKSNLNLKKSKIKMIYNFALTNRGGQIEDFEVQQEFQQEAYKLAAKIKIIVERLASFLKEKELKGFLRIFFKSGRLILELILVRCKININYEFNPQGLSTQVIVFTMTVGGTAGFIISWISVGTILVSPSILVSVLLLRSLGQQILNQKEYSKFKKIVNRMLDDDELKERIRAVFIEGPVEDMTPRFGKLEIKPLDSDKNPALQHDFDSKSGEDWTEFIKARMKKELGLIENPSETQLQEIIRKRKPKGKTVFFRDFIDQLPSEGADLPDTVIDAEILEEPIRIKSEKPL